MRRSPPPVIAGVKIRGAVQYGHTVKPAGIAIPHLYVPFQLGQYRQSLSSSAQRPNGSCVEGLRR
eukprot:8855411-Heterocapsa_arctica.AAC.1